MKIIKRTSIVRERALHRWHKWFCWYPILIPISKTKESIIWLKIVYRKGVLHNGYDGGFWSWKFKECK